MKLIYVQLVQGHLSRDPTWSQGQLEVTYPFTGLLITNPKTVTKNCQAAWPRVICTTPFPEHHHMWCGVVHMRRNLRKSHWKGVRIQGACLRNLRVPNGVFFHLLLSVVLQGPAVLGWDENGNNGHGCNTLLPDGFVRCPWVKARRGHYDAACRWLPCQGLGPTGDIAASRTIQQEVQEQYVVGAFILEKW